MECLVERMMRLMLVGQQCVQTDRMIAWDRTPASEFIIQKLKKLSIERSMLIPDKAKYQSQLKDQADHMDQATYTAKRSRTEIVINAPTACIRSFPCLCRLLA